MAHNLSLNVVSVPTELRPLLLVDEVVPAQTPTIIRRVGVRVFNGVEWLDYHWEVGGTEAQAQKVLTNTVTPFLRRGAKG